MSSFRMLPSMIKFFKNLFYKKQCNYAMNIGTALKSKVPSYSFLQGKSVLLYLWQMLPSTSRIKAAYPSKGHLKGFSKTSGKIFYVRKTTNIGISHDQQHAIYHQTFCLMVIEKLFQGLYQWYDFSSKTNSICSHFYCIYMINYFALQYKQLKVPG